MTGQESGVIRIYGQIGTKQLAHLGHVECADPIEGGRLCAALLREIAAELDESVTFAEIVRRVQADNDEQPPTTKET